MERLERSALALTLRNKLRKRPRDVYLEHVATDAGLTHGFLKALVSGKHGHPHEKNLLKLKAYFDKADA